MRVLRSVTSRNRKDCGLGLGGTIFDLRSNYRGNQSFFLMQYQGNYAYEGLLTAYTCRRKLRKRREITRSQLMTKKQVLTGRKIILKQKDRRRGDRRHWTHFYTSFRENLTLLLKGREGKWAGGSIHGLRLQSQGSKDSL